VAEKTERGPSTQERRKKKKKEKKNRPPPQHSLVASGRGGDEGRPRGAIAYVVYRGEHKGTKDLEEGHTGRGIQPEGTWTGGPVTVGLEKG